MTSNPLPTYYHIILPNEDSSLVLIQVDSDGCVLPNWSTVEPAFWQDTMSVNRGAMDLLGLRVATLRASRLDWTGDRRDSYYVVESLERKWQPPGGMRWIGAVEATRCNWRYEADLRALMDWFEDVPSPTRVDWYRPGWYGEARAWIDGALSEAALARTGPVEQMRSWERSSIMRVGTTAGMHYFKAVAPQWGHEPPLTASLAAEFPRSMPDILKVDAGTGMMLVREFTGQALPNMCNPGLWKRGYAELGRVQRTLAGRVDRLAQLGVPFRPLDTILDGLPELMADGRLMRLGMDGGLSDNDLAVLQRSQSTLATACRRLMDGPVPLSLDHGDFWPGNIFASDRRVTLFDWSDAAITHPFFSLVMAADEIEKRLDGGPEGAHVVIDAYLSEWTDIASIEKLRRIFDDAMLVAPIHQALMYRSIYLPAMEFRDELDRMPPHFLRWLAGRLREPS